jgi:hypothetical protein
MLNTKTIQTKTEKKMTDRTYGEKYDNSLDVKDIAKLMRAEVKKSIKAGIIPKGTKVSVRIERYSMGQSIDINVKEFPMQAMNMWRVKFMEDYPHRCLSDIPSEHPAYEMWTPIAKRTLNELKRIQGLWNHDGSDTMTDYFDVNYYGDAGFDYRLEYAQRDKIKESVSSVNWPESWAGYFEN